MLGYANEAKRNGRGMSSAVRASGSSSHDLSSGKHLHSTSQNSCTHTREKQEEAPPLELPVLERSQICPPQHSFEREVDPDQIRRAVCPLVSRS